jgi:hypothetical protein
LAAAAAILLVVGGVMWFIGRSQQAELRRMQRRLNELAAREPREKAILAETELIDQWKQGSINWLDELAEISNRLLLPDEAIVDSLDGRLARDRGVISLRGRAASAPSENRLQTELAGRPYRIDSKSATAIGGSDIYRVEFVHELSLGLDAAVDEALPPDTPPPGEGK